MTSPTTMQDLQAHGLYRRRLLQLAGSAALLPAARLALADPAKPATGSSPIAPGVVVRDDLMSHFKTLDVDGCFALFDVGANRLVLVNAGESPLARLKLRGLVDPTQFAAGERLRRDFTLAQMTPRMGVNWEAPVVSGGRGAGADHQSDIAVAARQRLNRALVALGPGLSDLAFDICCHLKTLEEAERGRGWAQRAARVVLKIALDRLAAHYGMGVTRSSAPVRAWHAPEAV